MERAVTESESLLVFQFRSQYLESSIESCNDYVKIDGLGGQFLFLSKCLQINMLSDSVLQEYIYLFLNKMVLVWYDFF